jgi:glycosyltransferase involved in cell wall biosynthesis
MKFSIVTPAWNIATWLPKTIESVLSQEGDFEIEYTVVIDQSTDDTAAIARSYAEKINAGTYPIRCKKITMQVIEPETRAGMAGAINLGFAHATGDIVAWIPADDLYEKGGFEAARRVFEAFPDIAWLIGVNRTVDHHDVVLSPGTCKIYHQDWLRAGIYGMEAYHVEQSGTFWRPEVWNACGPFPEHYRVMPDYWLWIQFARYARLWSVNAPMSLFRKRPDQGTKTVAAYCLEKMWEARGGRRPLRAWGPRLFFYPYYHVVPVRVRPLMEWCYRFVFRKHSREYIDFENGAPVMRTMDSFTLK